MDEIAQMILSGSVFVIALVALTFSALVLFNQPGQSTHVEYVDELVPYTSNASIGISLPFSAYMHTQARVSVIGNGTDFSMNVDRAGIPYGLPIVKANSSVSGATATNTSGQVLPNALYSSYSDYILVTRLYPDSSYTVMIKGSAAPVCLPGRVCPDFIMGINEEYNITTGSNGSVVNVSASLP
ncbi:MAG: hypothetical protein ACP5MZ_02510 [Candidatus Micrarchaeia archaeon]